MSLRDRYLKIILPNLSSYQLPHHQHEVLNQAKKTDNSKSYTSLRIAEELTDEESNQQKSKCTKILDKSDKILIESPAAPSEVKRKANALKIPSLIQESSKISKGKKICVKKSKSCKELQIF